MFITVNGVKKSLPRYYIKLLGESIDIEKMEKMRLEREQKLEIDLADCGVGILERSVHLPELRKRRWSESETLAQRKSRKF